MRGLIIFNNPNNRQKIDIMLQRVADQNLGEKQGKKRKKKQSEARKVGN